MTTTAPAECLNTERCITESVVGNDGDGSVMWQCDGCGYRYNDGITPEAIIWVCTDCHYAHHSGEPEHCTPGVEPWALIGKGHTVTDYTRAEGDADEDDPSGVRDFDIGPCQGCGTQIGGSFFRYAVWGEDQN